MIDLYANLAAIWVLCGLLAAGFYNAAIRREMDPHRYSSKRFLQAFGIAVAVGVVFAPLALLSLGFEYLKRKSSKERPCPHDWSLSWKRPTSWSDVCFRGGSQLIVATRTLEGGRGMMVMKRMFYRLGLSASAQFSAGFMGDGDSPDCGRTSLNLQSFVSWRKVRAQHELALKTALLKTAVRLGNLVEPELHPKK
jgi:hypothetical protein